MIPVLTQFSFSSELLSFYEFDIFSALSTVVLPNLNPCRLERRQVVISIFYLLKPALCCNTWSVLRKALWAAERQVYSLVLGWNFLLCLLDPFDLWHYSTLTFLFSFCLNDLFIADIGYWCHLRSLSTSQYMILAVEVLLLLT